MTTNQQTDEEIIDKFVESEDGLCDCGREVFWESLALRLMALARQAGREEETAAVKTDLKTLMMDNLRLQREVDEWKRKHDCIFHAGLKDIALREAELRDACAHVETEYRNKKLADEHIKKLEAEKAELEKNQLPISCEGLIIDGCQKNGCLYCFNRTKELMANLNASCIRFT